MRRAVAGLSGRPPLESSELYSARRKLPDNKLFLRRNEMFAFLTWRRHVEVEYSWTSSHKGLEDIFKLSAEPPCVDGRRQLFVKIAVSILARMSSFLEDTWVIIKNDQICDISFTFLICYHDNGRGGSSQRMI